LPIQSFADQGTEDLFHGRNTPAARRTLPRPLWKIARRKLMMLHAAGDLRDLAQPPGNRLEALKGNRQGQYSIRINDQYRICFIWTSQGPGQVEVVDYHK